MGALGFTNIGELKLVVDLTVSLTTVDGVTVEVDTPLAIGISYPLEVEMSLFSISHLNAMYEMKFDHMSQQMALSVSSCLIGWRHV